MEKEPPIQGTLEREIHISGVSIGSDWSATVSFYRVAKITNTDNEKAEASLPMEPLEHGPQQLALSAEQVAKLLTLPSPGEMVEAIHELRRDAREQAANS